MVGDKIKQRRIELGMTQEDLMKKMGYSSRASISRLESGTRDIGQESLKKLADVLGVDVNYFFDFPADELQDQLFERNKVLFDLSKKCTPDDLEKIIKIVEVMTNEDTTT